jgi:hypothetical protein
MDVFWSWNIVVCSGVILVYLYEFGCLVTCFEQFQGGQGTSSTLLDELEAVCCECLLCLPIVLLCFQGDTTDNTSQGEGLLGLVLNELHCRHAFACGVIGCIAGDPYQKLEHF